MRFGIEIETVGLNPTRAAQVVSAAGVECVNAGYTHATMRTWKAVSDGSLSSGHNAAELVSPILDSNNATDWLNLRLLCEALQRAGARVDRSCGLHVHIDASGLSGAHVASVVTRYATYESTIDSFMPASRRGNTNTYCRSAAYLVQAIRHAGANATPQAMARQQESRFLKVNLQSLLRHGTIEFRQHSGTIDSTKIENWVRFLIAFVEASAPQASAPTPGQAMATAMGLGSLNSLPVSAPNVRERINTLRGMRHSLATAILDSGARGRTVSELAHQFQWEEHTVRAEVSRSLRRNAGLPIESFHMGGALAYRITTQAGAPAPQAGAPAPQASAPVTASAPATETDHVWRNIPLAIAGFYRERIQDFAAN